MPRKPVSWSGRSFPTIRVQAIVSSRASIAGSPSEKNKTALRPRARSPATATNPRVAVSPRRTTLRTVVRTGQRARRRRALAARSVDTAGSRQNTKPEAGSPAHAKAFDGAADRFLPKRAGKKRRSGHHHGCSRRAVRRRVLRVPLPRRAQRSPRRGARSHTLFSEQPAANRRASAGEGRL